VQPGVLAGSGRADDAAAVVWWTCGASAPDGGGIAASKQAGLYEKKRNGGVGVGVGG